jgi:hypothetical protein
MRAPRPALVVLAVLLASSLAPAAPAPDPSREAKEKLEALKKRLPDVLDAWMKAYPLRGRTGDGAIWTEVLVLRRARLVASAEAKLTFYSYRETGGARATTPSHILTVFLKYHDGLWTTTSYRGGDPYPRGVDFLLDAIDEAAEKK